MLVKPNIPRILGSSKLLGVKKDAGQGNRPACGGRLRREEKSLFAASKMPDDLPEGALGLPELIFEDKIEYEELEELVRSALLHG